MKIQPPESYQPEADELFRTVKSRLQKMFPYFAIEHVGSSAVPGAYSKGDLDICLVVPRSMIEFAVVSLVSAGYLEKLDTLRTSELCMLEWHEIQSMHAVQVVADRSRYMNFIHFRDILLHHPKLVDEYSKIKKAHASATALDYRNEKSKFIERVLEEYGNAVLPTIYQQ
jgi:GrpB-like predicted nucleotidyltransferase (UPF0157 family)